MQEYKQDSCCDTDFFQPAMQAGLAGFLSGLERMLLEGQDLLL